MYLLTLCIYILRALRMYASIFIFLSMYYLSFANVWKLIHLSPSLCIYRLRALRMYACVFIFLSIYYLSFADVWKHIHSSPSLSTAALHIYAYIFIYESMYKLSIDQPKYTQVCARVRAQHTRTRILHRGAFWEECCDLMFRTLRLELTSVVRIRFGTKTCPRNQPGVLHCCHMNVYMYTYTHTCVCICTYVYIYIHVCISIIVRVYVNVYTYSDIYDVA